MAISKFQKFEAVTIKRSSIKNAPYNPRKIGDKEQKALRKSLKTHGLVETLVWNKTTGNLVGGHQRLSQLDVLEGKPDYELTVAMVKVNEKQEKELNIALNNPSMQGEYDFDMLKDLLPGLDIENTGFTEYDLSVIGVDEDLEKREEDNYVAGTKHSIEDIKAAKAASKEKNISGGENYIVVTFSTIEAKESFLEKLGHEPDDRYMKGEILEQKLFPNESNEQKETD
ncbi:MAG: ParB N-terminal domain-containing protein [Chitinophagaceae bacterium]|nr:ParB N-terminal domain-containing protein [Chitinophagaceae bacterium]